MPLEPGELYVPGSPGEIRDDILTDIRLESRNAGVEVAVSPGTDTYIWATALANAAYLQYSGIASLRNSLTPLDAVGEDLDRWRRALGLPVVEPSPATGKIKLEVTGSGSVPDGTQFVLPNGLRGEVVGNWIGVVDGAEVDVRTIDKGAATNLASGEGVRFVSPPLNVSTDATVSKTQPLTGGTDAESDPRKLERILNRLQNTPGGGNWGQLRELAFNASPIVQNAYVYPALGGPSSVKVVLVKELDPTNNDFSRAVNSTATALIRDEIQANTPGEVEVIVQSVADETVDVTIAIEIPDSALSGGNGLGWLDQTPWPPLDGGDTRVSVTSVTSSSQIIVNASTSTSPVAGQTRITWWAPGDQRFRTALVTAVSGATTAWTLTLDRPLVDSDGNTVAVGDYISPAAEKSADYGSTWRTLLGQLGPGENTADANKLPRAKRHPFVSDSEPEDLSILQLNGLINEHDEITDAEFSYRSLSSPTVPASVDTAPNVLKLRHFGIYKK